MKITKATIDVMRFKGQKPSDKDVRADDEVAGFGVRVWPSGKKTFIYEYRFHGRMRYLTLGKYGTLTLVQARDMARARAAEVAKGIDPQAEKVRLRQGETVADLAKAFIVRHSRPHNKTWEDDQARLDTWVIPVLGAVKVAAVTRQDVARLHSRIGLKHPTTANRVLSLISSMWNRARLDFGFLPQSHPNPAEGIKRFDEVKRERFVLEAEMPALARAIDLEHDVFVKALIWLYLFTGLRKNELLTLRWQDVDLVGMRIHLGDTKSGRPHYLPITQLAAELFRHLPKLGGNSFVFCGKNDGCHLVNISKPWDRIRKAAGLEDVRLHDLRRTVGSWMAQGGYSLPLIGRVLNHSNQSTTAIYARFHLDPVAAAMEATSRKISEARVEKGEAHGTPSGEMVSAAEASAVD